MRLDPFPFADARPMLLRQEAFEMPDDTPTEKTFDTGELSINYGELPGPGRPLVMLHGMTADWLGFRDLMSRLSGRWHPYACDLRGHGKSGRSEGRYALPDYERDAISFLEEVSGPAILLGHSLGALTALLCAAHRPELALGLILLDPPVYVRNAPLETHPGVKDWFGWVYETMESRPGFERVVEACRLREPDEDEKALHIMALRVSRVDPGTVRAALRNEMGNGADMDRALTSLRCPTLILRGEWRCGACVRDEDAAWMHSLSPAASIVQLPGGNHGFLWEKADQTQRLIEDFLVTLA